MVLVARDMAGVLLARVKTGYQPCPFFMRVNRDDTRLGGWIFPEYPSPSGNGTYSESFTGNTG